MRVVGKQAVAGFVRATDSRVGRATAAYCRSATVGASVDCLGCLAAPTASTSPLSRGFCGAHRWVHSRNQVPGTPCSTICSSARTLHDLAIAREPSLGSHSAKGGQGSGGVCTVICPGKRHFANLLDSSRPSRGLLHTEEVTGSIPVSPPELAGQLRSCLIRVRRRLAMLAQAWWSGPAVLIAVAAALSAHAWHGPTLSPVGVPDPAPGCLADCGRTARAAGPGPLGATGARLAH
jgi:hypothetical protein